MTYYTPLIVLVWLSLAILAILAKENDRFTKEKKKILYVTYLIVGVAALAEWLGVQLSGDPAVPVWLLKTVKLFDYILTPMAGGAVVLQFQTHNVWRKALFGVLGINTLYQTVSFFTGWMITIDDSHRYVHGPGYVGYIAICLTVVFLVIFEFGIYGREFRRQNHFSLFAILLLSVVGIVLQEVMGSEVRTAYIALTVGLALLFIHNSEFAQLASDDRIQEQTIRISEDPLTGIASRYAYTAAVQNTPLTDDLVVYSIDINGLKTVNDTLGHSAGDELICGASGCIASVFAPYGTCYRTGGDEFIAFVNIESELIALLADSLRRKAAEWHGQEAPNLSLSIGSVEAAAHPGITLEKLISLADQEMYKDKATYYQQAGIDRRKV